ncbi:MAG: porin [Fuerstiella sp.]
MTLRIHSTLLLLASLTLTTSAANADDITFEQLLQRLESTETRLKELESEKTTNIFSTSFQNGQPLAVPPASEPTDPNDSDESKDDFEARLDKLEQGWEELDDAWSTFDKAQKKKKSDAAKKPSFKINGRIHADFWSFTNDDGGEGFLENRLGSANAGADPEDRFAFRRIRLETKGDIFENMLWRLQVEFSDPSSTQFRDVYLGFKNLPNNQTLLIGNQKRPLGLDHLNSSRYNVFLERPGVIEAFNEDARRPGIAVYGYSDDEKYNWRYGAYYLENIQGDGEAIGDSRQLSGNFRLASSPWYDEASGGRGYWHWAVSGQVARPDGNRTGDETNQNDGRFRTRPEARSTNRWLDTGRIDGADWFQTAGVESLFNVGPLQITGEYQGTFLQREGFQDVNFHGGYVYVSYILTGEHIPYDRKSGTIGRLQPAENFFLVDKCDGCTGRGWGAWGVAARYSYLDLTDKDVQGGVGNSATLALNWYWNAYSKVQFNAIYGNIDDRDPATGTTGADYLIFGTRFAVEF